VRGASLAGLLALVALSGCGSSAPAPERLSLAPGEKQAAEPFTAKQNLIEDGARLFIADGCSACHQIGSTRAPGPSFQSFAGHVVTLSDGRRVLVDEPFLRRVLSDPSATPLRGYDPAGMRAAVLRAHLASSPSQVAALAAFIEEVGPEPG
jgi:cytochrome c5